MNQGVISDTYSVQFYSALFYLILLCSPPWSGLIQAVILAAAVLICLCGVCLCVGVFVSDKRRGYERS